MDQCKTFEPLKHPKHITKFQLIVAMLALLMLSNMPRVMAQNLDKEVWEQERDKYVYKDREKKQVNKEIKFNNREVNQGLSMVMRVIFYGMLIALIVFLIVRFAPKKLGTAEKKPKLRKTESIEDAENNLNQVDLTDLLKNLENQGDLRGALRVQLLILLQWAQNNNLIKWRKWKTNGMYAREWPNENRQAYFKEFASETDFYWWGNHQPATADYARLRQNASLIKNPSTRPKS